MSNVIDFASVRKYGSGGNAKNDDELFIKLSSDNELQDALRDMVLSQMQIGQKRNTNPEKTLRRYSDLLMNSIEKKLRRSGTGFEGKLFSDDIKYDKNRKCLTIEFSEDAFQPNLFKTHVSFVPILYNYGWEVGNNKYPYSGISGSPTFRYYAGSYFITEAVQEFNEKYRDKNMYANFLMGDMNLTLYEGNGKLPYIQRYL